MFQSSSRMPKSALKPFSESKTVKFRPPTANWSRASLTRAKSQTASASPCEEVNPDLIIWQKLKKKTNGRSINNLSNYLLNAVILVVDLNGFQQRNDRAEEPELTQMRHDTGDILTFGQGPYEQFQATDANFPGVWSLNKHNNKTKKCLLLAREASFFFKH